MTEIEDDDIKKRLKNLENKQLSMYNKLIKILFVILLSVIIGFYMVMIKLEEILEEIYWSS